MRYLWIVLLIGMAGVAGAEMRTMECRPTDAECFSGTIGTIHLDNCAAHGLEHSWKYYRIWKAPVVECGSTDGITMTCKDVYNDKEINYPSGATMDLPHGDYDDKVFRRVCKNCKLSEDMRVIHKETWEKTE